MKKVEHILPMVAGNGETSYASNSGLQKKAIVMKKGIVEDALREIYTTILPEKMVVADLGCSSGPNAFLVVSDVIEAVGNECRSLGRRPPELQFFLNDLPENDFNQLFRYLERFEKKLKEEKGDEEVVPHYVAGLPGSFYDRLFPSQTVHFFHSSYCLHWLSKVPQGLESKNGGLHLNERNIYIGTTSPPCVIELYQKQFNKDLSLFLQSRFKELVPGGQMVLAIGGRKELHVFGGGIDLVWELLSEALNSMVPDGLVEKDNLDSFNLPFYSPSMVEVEEVIKKGGLFDIIRSQIFEIDGDADDDSSDDLVRDNVRSAKYLTKASRAVMDPIIACQFGEVILDDLFSRFEKILAREFLKEKFKLTNLVLALRAKGE